MKDPYQQMGIKRNPFVVKETPGVPQPLWMDRHQPNHPLPNQCQYFQILGSRGVGKTSILFHWKEEQPGPYHYVAEDFTRWQLPPFHPIVYWDEIDRWAWWYRALIFFIGRLKKITIVAATHRDFSTLSKWLGFEVRQVTFQPLTPEELMEWAELRIQAARLNEEIATNLHLTQVKAEEIAAKAGDSLRFAADLLHIWAAEEAAKESRK
ncbi:Hypothetical protein PBC10988_8310 [Planctomycetales bacterium 10988]|nr:Hypothetical protein PBC10988_8310 [Planctomycetales bacterium 10988]